MPEFKYPGEVAELKQIYDSALAEYERREKEYKLSERERMLKGTLIGSMKPVSVGHDVTEKDSLDSAISKTRAYKERLAAAARKAGEDVDSTIAVVEGQKEADITSAPARLAADVLIRGGYIEKALEALYETLDDRSSKDIIIRGFGSVLEDIKGVEFPSFIDVLTRFSTAFVAIESFYHVQEIEGLIGSVAAEAAKNVADKAEAGEVALPADAARPTEVPVLEKVRYEDLEMGEQDIDMFSVIINNEPVSMKELSNMTKIPMAGIREYFDKFQRAGWVAKDEHGSFKTTERALNKIVHDLYGEESMKFFCHVSSCEDGKVNVSPDAFGRFESGLFRYPSKTELKDMQKMGLVHAIDKEDGTITIMVNRKECYRNF